MQSQDLARQLDLPKRAIALVLAGGRGSRLHDLTDRRAKPAVYFGGKFRIVDFALSNCCGIAKGFAASVDGTSRGEVGALGAGGSVGSGACGSFCMVS